MKIIFSTKLIAIVSIAAMFSLIACGENDEPTPVLPVVTTGSISNITEADAQGSGVITSDGGSPVIEAGLVWSYDKQVPDTSGYKVVSEATTGSFTGTMSIMVNTTYYVRAYAMNRVGIAYGDVISFSSLVDTAKVTFVYGEELVTYGIIVSPNSGRKWLDRNLGASRAATSITDASALGDLFQWGRLVDGHQIRTTTKTTHTFSSTDVPGHGDFILSINDAWDESKRWYDWRKPNNNNLWQGDNGINNPCPDGWHVPAKEEWEAENFGIDRNIPYTNLKLVLAGRRRGGAGNIDDENGTVAGSGYYWTSTPRSFPGSVSYAADAHSWYLLMGAVFGNDLLDADKADGLSVRCIKNI